MMKQYCDNDVVYLMAIGPGMGLSYGIPGWGNYGSMPLGTVRIRLADLQGVQAQLPQISCLLGDFREPNSRITLCSEPDMRWENKEYDQEDEWDVREIQTEWRWDVDEQQPVVRWRAKDYTGDGCHEATVVVTCWVLLI